jgi:hypothetical protein
VSSDEQQTAVQTWDLVSALVRRPGGADAAREAFRRAYPQAPARMLDAAVFHIYVDGVKAALEWLAAAERFLREPGEGFDYGATWHLLYHLYNWLQLQALLPSGREGVLELLQDAKRFLAEQDYGAVQRVVGSLEEMFQGRLSPPGVG